MRDLLLLTVLPYLIYVCFKRTYLGLALWFWSSLVPLSVYGYGIATSVRWNFIFAVCTMASYFFNKHKAKFEFNSTVLLLIVFFTQATLSSTFHIGFDLLVWQEWNYLFKSFVFLVFVLLIVEKKLHFQALMWACALSISARAAQEGVKVIFSAGGHKVFGITPTFNDNNLSAMAVLICLPMLIYLFTQYRNLYIKAGLVGLLITNIVFVFGSDSRGGFLGLLVLGSYFFIKSNRKIPISLFLLTVAIISLNLMDDAWFDRMQSIKNADEDSSFMGRVVSWKLAIILALENPLLGGGFDAAAYQPTWLYLVSQFDKVSFIPSPDPYKMHVAHSIYFQVLGDLGFLGLLLYLLMLIGTFLRLRRVSKLAQELWLKDFAKFMMLAVVAFAVAGAALSAAYNELFLMIFATSIVSLKRISNTS